MNISDAQNDMRRAYYNGSTGALASGSIWLLSGIIALLSSDQTSILVFFIGGMFIFPASILISKMLKRSGQHQKENPLATLAIESTVLLFIGLFIAYIGYQSNPNWFYSIMLLTIGGRYLLFQSMYGKRLYWVFGIVLIIAGVVCILTGQQFHVGAILGGAIELVFALLLFKV